MMRYTADAFQTDGCGFRRLSGVNAAGTYREIVSEDRDAAAPMHQWLEVNLIGRQAARNTLAAGISTLKVDPRPTAE